MFTWHVQSYLVTPFTTFCISMNAHRCWASCLFEVSHCDIIQLSICINYARVGVIAGTVQIKIKLLVFKTQFKWTIHTKEMRPEDKVQRFLWVYHANIAEARVERLCMCCNRKRNNIEISVKIITRTSVWMLLIISNAYEMCVICVTGIKWRHKIIRVFQVNRPYN